MRNLRHFRIQQRIGGQYERKRMSGCRSRLHEDASGRSTETKLAATWRSNKATVLISWGSQPPKDTHYVDQTRCRISWPPERHGNGSEQRDSNVRTEASARHMLGRRRVPKVQVPHISPFSESRVWRHQENRKFAFFFLLERRGKQE